VSATNKPARPWLLPLVPVYAAALRAKAGLLRFRRQRRLGRPVLSVGSVSAGGAGKTPVVKMLAELLSTQGFAIRILSRGYGRASHEVERVDPAGDAARFGDEPMLLARSTGAAVYVGADRYAAGRRAEQREDANERAIYLLDDGFQHRRLARDLDIVLLTAADVADCLLPAGNLREPLAALRRADVVLLREEEAQLTGVVEALCGGGQTPETWLIRRRLVQPLPEPQHAGERSLPSHPVAFSGIARPESFTTLLAEEGCTPVAEVRFRDHHRYLPVDIDRLLRIASENGANGFVTTEKDAVKLSLAERARLQIAGPLVAPVLRVELLDEAKALRRILRAVE